VVPVAASLEVEAGEAAGTAGTAGAAVAAAAMKILGEERVMVVPG